MSTSPYTPGFGPKALLYSAWCQKYRGPRTRKYAILADRRKWRASTTKHGINGLGSVLGLLTLTNNIFKHE